MFVMFLLFGPLDRAPAGSISSGTEPAGPISRLVQWIFLYGDRRVIGLLTSIIILISIVVVGTVWKFEMERLVTETRAVQALFNTLLGGIILFVSVVLSINTAALTQEFTPLQVKLTHIEDSVDFQLELEDLVGEGVAPAGMRPFLGYVIRAIRAETDSLQATADSADTEQARNALSEFLDDVDAELTLIENRIRDPDTRISIILLSSLDYPYARHINRARRLKAVHGAEFTETGRHSLDELLQSLMILASGREYFTSLYFKRELRNLSTNLLLFSLPVIVFTSYVLLATDAGSFPDITPPGVGSRLFYVNIAFVVALSPYILLSSYMLRILTVSKHSLEATVFTLDTDTSADYRD